MKIKTSELEGAALDYAVAAVTGVHDDGEHAVMEIGLGRYSPSTDWSQGGPLIEDRIYKLEQTGTHTWIAWLADMQSAEWRFSSGSTPLIAAMRAIVAAELGDEVGVPDELAT